MTRRLAALSAGTLLLLAAESSHAEAFLRLPVEADLTALVLHPTRVIDYGAFRWVIVADDEAARLAASGRSDLLVPDAGEVRVPGYSFDPRRDGEPPLDSADRASAGDAGLRLVQLVGPPRADWYRELEGAGLRVLQYYPHNSYLVWCDSAAAARARELSFVRWAGGFHPAYKLGSALAGRSGRIDNLVAFVYVDATRDDVVDRLTAIGGLPVRVSKASADGAFQTVELAADASTIPSLARDPNVIWLGYRSPRPLLEDEMSDQIVAGNHSAGVPVTGYPAHLANLGVDGTGIVWAISDTGVDWDHPDLASHIVGGFSPPDASCVIAGQPGSDCPGGGHGTHVAGIVAGDGTAGFSDGSGFAYGLGMAPETSLFAINIFADSVTLADMTREALAGGAIGSNNSWATTAGFGHGYTADCRMEDTLVRDGNLETASFAEPFLQVFSAGNSGSLPSTITEPKEAKNIVTVANSLNARAGNLDAIAGGSSRGPAIDGRTLPTIAAPGTSIASTRNDSGGSCAIAIADTSDRYAFCSGTSMASPHAAGAVVLAAQWWRTTHAGADPSMAMAKALLVNGAVDMGTADIPNNNEGWGRVDITRVIQPAVAAVYFDQALVLTGTGQQTTRHFVVDDPAQPLRVTLAWSDAPGAAGANPALVNNLDLRVIDSSQTYLGNVFSAGASIPGGIADSLNNLENVYLATPVSGLVTVAITGSLIAGDGVPYNGFPTDQDFALVCSNCRLPELFVDGFESNDTSAWSLAVP
ncbi:MAG: S8 family serine peptidase [Thermoanaerobaculia bacterium]